MRDWSNVIIVGFVITMSVIFVWGLLTFGMQTTPQRAEALPPIGDCKVYYNGTNLIVLENVSECYQVVQDQWYKCYEMRSEDAWTASGYGYNFPKIYLQPRSDC